MDINEFRSLMQEKSPDLAKDLKEIAATFGIKGYIKYWYNEGGCVNYAYYGKPKPIPKHFYEGQVFRLRIENMLEDIITGLGKFKGHWPLIAEKADVSYSWLGHVYNGRTVNPQVKECERVLKVIYRIENGEINLKKSPSSS